MNAASWLENIPAPDRWRDLVLARGPMIATVVLVVALGLQAGVIVMNLIGGVVPAASPESLAAAQPASAPERKFVNPATIANAHLFGSAEVEAPQQDAANAPQTSLPLVLTGIIANDDPEQGLAIIGENAGSARVKAVGDSLPGGATLHSVYGDRVMLDRSGRLESLALPRQFQSTAPPPTAASLTPTETPIVERMRRLIADQPGVISDIMRPQPVFAQGKQRGYRVYPGRNRQAFIRLGLRPGDLVTAINGTPLDDPARGQEIFSTIGSASEAQVTVMRNGQQQDLTLNMAQVAQQAEALVGGQEGVIPPEQAPAIPAPPPDEADEE
jgi:general secretion pathway protein C